MTKLCFPLCTVILLMLICTPGFTQNSNSITLSGKWKVVWNDGNKGSNDITTFMSRNPLSDTLKYVTVDVPMDLNLAMQKRGMQGDLYFGVNTLFSGWVARQYWQYYRHFTVPKEALNKSAWLVFNKLDYSATVYINGIEAGKHNNAFIPCRMNVTGKLKEGNNIITVGIESGLFESADKEITPYNPEIRTRLNKRVWLRKPAYQFGWDWNPSLINVGITGDVSLEWKEKARLDQVVTITKMSDDLSTASLTIRPFIEGLQESANITVEATILETNQKTSIQIKPTLSVNPVDLQMKVLNPELWWPVGYGKPSLYTLKVEIKENGKPLDSAIRRIGFRKIEVDRSAHPVEGNYFTIKVNNQKVFMKGGNWVPADMISGNVDKKRIESLVNLALQANFNILRIWGGGEFAGNDLLDLCDEKGLVVWHDFLFACAKYPGENSEFYNAVKNEVTWAVREFSTHPSLLVWCGNNENELGTFAWGYTSGGKIVPDYILYHHLIPQIIKKENPEIFYWPSSPFSENYADPNNPLTGDQHPWSVSLGSDNVNFQAYRNYVDRFPNEGGFLGASSPATLRQFLPADQQYIRSVAWDHHDNLVNFWQEKDVTYRTVEYWTGRSFRDLSFDDYVFASGLLQAEALSEYISNFHRRMFSSSCAIFWMYNDSWPVTHGWTIVDYYLRKKMAFHPVRRAFSQQTVVIAEENDKINIYGINDSNQTWTGTLQYGIFKTTGGLYSDKNTKISLPPNVSVVIASFSKSDYQKAGLSDYGTFAVLKKGDIPVSQYRLLQEKFSNIKFEKPEITITYKNGYAVLTSPVYVWGACLDINGESSVEDNCFDLLPGIPYYVKINQGEIISVLKTGNDILLRK